MLRRALVDCATDNGAGNITLVKQICRKINIRVGHRLRVAVDPNGRRRGWHRQIRSRFPCDRVRSALRSRHNRAWGAIAGWPWLSRGAGPLVYHRDPWRVMMVPADPPTILTTPATSRLSTAVTPATIRRRTASRRRLGTTAGTTSTGSSLRHPSNRRPRGIARRRVSSALARWVSSCSR